jgi:hypothetical protein
MRNFIHHDFPELERKTSETGSRVYVTPQGNIYPSVTTVTGLHSKEGIQQWRNRVGHLEADRVTKSASNRGDAIHKYCEKFLLDQPIVFDNLFYDFRRVFRAASHQFAISFELSPSVGVEPLPSGWSPDVPSSALDGRICPLYILAPRFSISEKGKIGTVSFSRQVGSRKYI